jgi:hypothetical protein
MFATKRSRYPGHNGILAARPRYGAAGSVQYFAFQRLRPGEWMLLLLSSGFGAIESADGEGGAVFELGVCAGADLESS